MLENDVILIDGSQGEGGGQILRTAVGLAAALGVAVRVTNIRPRRKPPGLRPQHLAAVTAAAKFCSAEVTGAEVGSRELVFCPGQVQPGEYRFDIGTAGSTTLVIQALLPALVLGAGESKVTVVGGTHNPMAPCFHYLRDVFGVLASAMTVEMYLEMSRAGFYPAGGGEVCVQVLGADYCDDLSPIRLRERGELRKIQCLSAASKKLPEHIVHRQAQQAAQRLAGVGVEVETVAETWDTLSPGTAVFLRAVFGRSVAGFTSLGRLGKPAEKVADEAADELLEFLQSPGAVEPHAADQLITLAALCPEESVISTSRVTEHLLTNAAVIRQITGREVTVDAPAGQPGTVTLTEMP